MRPDSVVPPGWCCGLGSQHHSRGIKRGYRWSVRGCKKQAVLLTKNTNKLSSPLAESRQASAAIRQLPSRCGRTTVLPSGRSSDHGRSDAADSYCATAAPRSPSLTASETSSAASDGQRACGGGIGSDTDVLQGKSCCVQ